MAADGFFCLEMDISRSPNPREFWESTGSIPRNPTAQLSMKLQFNILIQRKHQSISKNTTNVSFHTMESQMKLVGMIPIRNQLRLKSMILLESTRLKHTGNTLRSTSRINMNAIRLPIFITNSCFTDVNPSIIFLFLVCSDPTERLRS